MKDIENIREQIRQLCDALNISPIDLTREAETVKQDYVYEKQAMQIAKREVYVGRYFKIDGDAYYDGESYYCKVINSRSEFEGCVSGLMIPADVEAWFEETRSNKVYIGFSQIDIMEIPVGLLKEENEISAEEYARVAHDYVDKMLNLKFN